VAVCQVYVEAGKRRVFACALDWPGWARAARTPDAALAALTAYAPRYAAAVASTGMDFAVDDMSELAVIESVTGTATTDFGALDVTPRADTGPHPPARYGRAAVLVQAAWDALTAAAAGAPAMLSRGPRGGGRDRDAILWHVLETEILHARMLGGRHRPPAPGDTAAAAAARAYVLDAILSGPVAEPSEGAARRRRPVMFVARRTAWHSLDHAWELQDRTP
jgi:hypothetical protein